MAKKVTLAWDGLPTIVLDCGGILPRNAELILHKKYYPNWPEETWPIDPETGLKLEIECEIYSPTLKRQNSFLDTLLRWLIGKRN